MLTNDYILMRPMRLRIEVVPGPPHDDSVLYSHAIQVIARYSADEIARTISTMPRIELVTDGSRDPRAWQWVWREGDRSIRVGFSTLGKDLDANTWGGSTLDVDGYVGDLVTFWAHLRRAHADTWLHYDGRVFTAAGLIDQIRRMLLDQVVTDIY